MEINHKQRHGELHESLLEVIKDWQSQAADSSLEYVVLYIITWSYKQKVRLDHQTLCHKDSNRVEFDHSKRHWQLNYDLSELCADWESLTDSDSSKNSINELCIWSAKQAEEPDHTILLHRDRYGD